MNPGKHAKSKKREQDLLWKARINRRFWETAHLPLPKPNILPKERT